MGERATRFSPNRPDVIDEVFDGEAVIVNLRTGRYYSLDAAGTDIWQQALAGRSIDDMVADLATRYSAPADVLERVVHSFLARLLDEELVNGPFERRDTAATHSEACSFAPTIQVFTDMTDLLLLDPIHEVDLEGSGWPSVSPAAPA
jgi:hypothetical protein